MGAFSGTGPHQTTGNVGVAIMAGVGSNLAFQDFETSAVGERLMGYLTVNGNMEKRTIELGALPETVGSFNLEFPAGTDISYFNTVVIQTNGESVGQAMIP
ncbi:MAG: hypothetical protein AAFY78_08905 [Cyanobacteria bacterium J06648_16]